VTESANSKTAPRPLKKSRYSALRPDPAVQVPSPDPLDAAASPDCTQYDAPPARVTMREMARFFREPENDPRGRLLLHLTNQRHVADLCARFDEYGRENATRVILHALRQDEPWPADYGRMPGADELPPPETAAKQIGAWAFFDAALRADLARRIRAGIAEMLACPPAAA
jgi:hypothetical protein